MDVTSAHVPGAGIQLLGRAQLQRRLGNTLYLGALQAEEMGPGDHMALSAMSSASDVSD